MNIYLFEYANDLTFEEYQHVRSIKVSTRHVTHVGLSCLEKLFRFPFSVTHLDLRDKMGLTTEKDMEWLVRVLSHPDCTITSLSMFHQYQENKELQALFCKIVSLELVGNHLSRRNQHIVETVVAILSHNVIRKLVLFDYTFEIEEINRIAEALEHNQTISTFHLKNTSRWERNGHHPEYSLRLMDAIKANNTIRDVIVDDFQHPERWVEVVRRNPRINHLRLISRFESHSQLLEKALQINRDRRARILASGVTSPIVQKRIFALLIW